MSAGPFTIAQFRVDFPEFANETKYTDAMITFWWGVADNRLNVIRWGDILTQGISLFVAHHITLQAMNVADVAAGADPGRGTGIIGGMSAGGVSVNMNVSDSTEADAGSWNETSYGKQFIRLARLMGIGVVFVP